MGMKTHDSYLAVIASIGYYAMLRSYDGKREQSLRRLRADDSASIHPITQLDLEMLDEEPTNGMQSSV